MVLSNVGNEDFAKQQSAINCKLEDFSFVYISLFTKQWKKNYNI